MILRLLFKLYYLVFSWPIAVFFGGGCRYTPTCSIYAKEAIKTHGFWSGSVLAIKRILRCHPWSSYGYDPVPKKTRD